MTSYEKMRKIFFYIKLYFLFINSNKSRRVMKGKGVTKISNVNNGSDSSEELR